MTLIERCDWLDKIADELENQIDEVARLESLDTGKPHEVALNVDASDLCMFQFLNFGRKMTSQTFEMEDAMNFVMETCWGCGINFSVESAFVSSFLESSARFVDGNTIIAKPSELTHSQHISWVSFSKSWCPLVLNMFKI